MSLRVCAADEYVLGVSRLNSSWAYYYGLYSYWHTDTYYTDFQLYAFREYDVVWYTFLEGLGLFEESYHIPANAQGTDYHELRIMPPENYPYTFLSDVSRQSSLLGNITLAFAVLHGGRGVPTHERQVLHSTVEGDAYPSEYVSYVSLVPDTVLSIDRDRRNASGGPTTFDVYGSPTGGTRTDWFYYGGDIEDYLSSVKGYLENNPNDLPYLNKLSARNITSLSVLEFDYSVEKDRIEISYAQRTKLVAGSTSSSTLVRTSISITRTSHFDGGSHWFNSEVTMSDSLGSQIVYAGAPEDCRWGKPGARYFKYLNPIAVVGTVEDSKDMDVEAIRVHLSGEHNRIHTLFPELLPSTYASTGDALSGYAEVLESNYVESLAELDQILDILPDLRPIRQLIEEVGVGRIISGAIRFVDIFTNLVLLTEFGLKPLYNDLYQVAVGLDDLVDRIQSLGERLDLRGKHTFSAFPEGDPLEGCVLVTRTKIVLTIPRGSALAAVLGFRMAGFNPSFSTVWDLIPFSFVVDWFANIGDRILVGEQMLHFLSADIEYLVHSHTVYSPISGMEGVAFSPDTEIKYYHRTTSRYLPKPGRSRYDFLTPNGPPVLAGGSLLWTLARP